MHLRSLERFPFDSVLLPYSFVGLQDDAYRGDVEELLGVCADQQVAVQTIKSIARRRWAPDHAGPRFSWYEPMQDEGAIARAVRWVLGNPQVFLNTSSDARLLGLALDAAENVEGDGGPTRPSDDEMQADLDALGVESLFDGADLERI